MGDSGRGVGAFPACEDRLMPSSEGGEYSNGYMGIFTIGDDITDEARDLTKGEGADSILGGNPGRRGQSEST